MTKTRAARAVAAIALAALAAAVLGWTVMRLPDADRTARLTTLANAIIRGGSFQPAALQGVIGKQTTREHGAICDAARLDALTILKLRVYEIALASGDSVAADRARQSLVAGIEDLLGCTPRSGFWWFVLFWTRTTAEGLNPSLLPFLEASYRLAPREGWIAVRRTKLASSLLPFAPPDLKARIAAEFSELLENGDIDAAAGILNGVRDDRRRWAVDLINRLGAVDRNQVIRRMAIRLVTLDGVQDPDRIAASVGGPRWYRDLDMPLGESLLSSSGRGVTIPVER